MSPQLDRLIRLEKLDALTNTQKLLVSMFKDGKTLEDAIISIDVVIKKTENILCLNEQ